MFPSYIFRHASDFVPKWCPVKSCKHAEKKKFNKLKDGFARTKDLNRHIREMHTAKKKGSKKDQKKKDWTVNAQTFVQEALVVFTSSFDVCL